MTAQHSTRVRAFRRSLVAMACVAAAPAFAQSATAPAAAASTPEL